MKKIKSFLRALGKAAVAVMILMVLGSVILGLTLVFGMKVIWIVDCGIIAFAIGRHIFKKIKAKNC